MGTMGNQLQMDSVRSICKLIMVLRDGRWSEEDAAVLVPGDIVSIKLGDIIPADARLLEGDPLKIDQVLTAIGNFCICSIAVGMVIEIIVMYPIQDRQYRPGIDNLLVLLIGGIPIAMPTVLSVTMAIGSHRLAQRVGSEEVIEVFAKGVDQEQVMLMAARASRIENQDAIDTATVGMLADPKEDLTCEVGDVQGLKSISLNDTKVMAMELMQIMKENVNSWNKGSFGGEKVFFF